MTTVDSAGLRYWNNRGVNSTRQFRQYLFGGEIAPEAGSIAPGAMLASDRKTDILCDVEVRYGVPGLRVLLLLRAAVLLHRLQRRQLR